MQRLLFDLDLAATVRPFRAQLLKWVGNKQRVAHQIVAAFPDDIRTYHEPFLGSGAVLATLAPRNARASDAFAPLIEIWRTLQSAPDELVRWYSERWHAMMSGDKETEYNRIRDSYNARPNGADLLFLCRTCYGGVVRFRQADGHMSTPCGPQRPISPESFARRARDWRIRTAHTKFAVMDYEEALAAARKDDLVYCDPPYVHTQRILYGAQEFRVENLFRAIDRCRSRGVRVALSIDGTKRSGDLKCELPIPSGLFKREVLIDCGRSMLRRFQLNGQTLESEVVADRLLLTY